MMVAHVYMFQNDHGGFMQVKDVMTKGIACVDSKSSAADAAKKMKDQNVGTIMVSRQRPAQGDRDGPRHRDESRSRSAGPTAGADIEDHDDGDHRLPGERM